MALVSKIYSSGKTRGTVYAFQAGKYSRKKHLKALARLRKKKKSK